MCLVVTELPERLKLVPVTKEEILANVRKRRQSYSGTESSSFNDSRSSETSNSVVGTGSIGSRQDEGNDSVEPSTIVRRIADNQSTEGSAGRYVDGNGLTDRRDGGSYSGPSSDSRRLATDYQSTTGNTPIVAKPVKRSKLEDYKQAAKELFGPKKDSGEKKQQSQKKPSGKVYSESEALKKREELIEVILLQSDNMDSAIQATTKGHLPVQIWSTMDRGDAENLADFLLVEARRNAAAAKFVEGLLDLRLKLQAGVIMGPRAYQTIITYWIRGFSIL